ncbi:hypothetical protein SLEP1_g762 [Rubroshorea leprosula]|uniref:peroxidase n=1 Tax=Rubroshorea leprosula TaxID=152421 RepID=A0AAV5HKC2_9ROSI|nr:hypothetical protein SLEP1_g762 [Rubroshorea leprosula]
MNTFSLNPAFLSFTSPMTGGVSWLVPTGRRDGTVSLASNVKLISPKESTDAQKQKFAAFGLNTQDLVALVGN